MAEIDDEADEVLPLGIEDEMVARRLADLPSIGGRRIERRDVAPTTPAADAPAREPAWPTPRPAPAPEPSFRGPARQIGRPAVAPPRPAAPNACVGCGLQLAVGARFCRRCGVRQDEGQPVG